MNVPIWVIVILMLVACGYGIAEMLVAQAQKSVALAYWYQKEPDKHHLFTIMLGAHIPMAIHCWIHYGNPLATWKLIEDETRR